MKKKYKEPGGKICYNMRVVKFEIEKKAATDVRLQDGSLVKE